ncbi:hypothetical protein ACQ9LF_13915, partial [Anaerohalosphaeraceae bacterium U12dextr]
GLAGECQRGCQICPRKIRYPPPGKTPRGLKSVSLSLINIVFLPLNLIASIGGMSEWTMITQGIDWRISYLLFCVGMVVLGWLTWIFMKKVIDKGPQQD